MALVSLYQLSSIQFMRCERGLSCSHAPRHSHSLVDIRSIWSISEGQWRSIASTTEAPYSARATPDRAPAVPCCSARAGTPAMPPGTTGTRRWSRGGGRMAAGSRDRKRWAAIGRRRRRAEVERRDGPSEERPARASCRPSGASSCSAGFETRSSPAHRPHARLNKSDFQKKMVN